MEGVRVREAAAGDLESLIGVYEELSGPLSEPVPEPAPDPREVIAEILADPSRSLLVGELDGRLAGFEAIGQGFKTYLSARRQA